MTEGLEIQDGDRIEVFEGSWAGRIGTVRDRDLSGEYIRVEFDDEPEPVKLRWVKACTTGRYVAQ